MIVKTETEDMIEAVKVCDKCFKEIHLVFRYKGNKARIWDMTNPVTNLQNTVSDGGICVDITHKHFCKKCAKEGLKSLMT